jgi:pimeloyl-ACP methyl ester carboxylesterase
VRAADSKLLFKGLYGATRAAALVSEGLAGRFAERLWFIPWRVDPGERALAKQSGWLAHTRPIAFHTTIGNIAGFQTGSGPTVMLLHGWGESAGSLGAYIAPLVEAGHRVIGIDLPGHGASVTAEPNIYAVAEVIREIAWDLGGVAAIVAHSMGGHSAIAALNDGLTVERVALLAPSSRLDHTMDRFTSLLSLPPRAARGLKKKLERRFGTTMWSDLSGARLASELDIEALVVHSKDDPQVPFEDSVELAEAWPKARLKVVEGLGHGRLLRDATVIDEVVSFIASTADREFEHAIG